MAVSNAETEELEGENRMIATRCELAEEGEYLHDARIDDAEDSNAAQRALLQ